MVNIDGKSCGNIAPSPLTTMREIKFRGKRVDNGEWVCGTLLCENVIRNHDTGYLVKTTNMSTDCSFECDGFRVDPVTVGQLTARVDDNLHDLWEGDLIAVADKVPWVIVWDRSSGGWMAEQDGHRVALGLMLKIKRMAVVGNIHDNSELIKR